MRAVRQKGLAHCWSFLALDSPLPQVSAPVQDINETVMLPTRELQTSPLKSQIRRPGDRSVFAVAILSPFFASQGLGRSHLRPILKGEGNRVAKLLRNHAWRRDDLAVTKDVVWY